MNVAIPIDPYTGFASVTVNGQSHKKKIEAKKRNWMSMFTMLAVPIRMVYGMVLGIFDGCTKPAMTSKEYKEFIQRKLETKAPIELDSPIEAECRDFIIATLHVTMETHGGTKVRLSFYNETKKVIRRVGVPRLNLRGKAAIQYVPVRALHEADFGHDFKFSVENAIIATKRDIGQGLLRDLLEIGTIPSSVTKTSAAESHQDVVLADDPSELKPSMYTKSATGQVVKMEKVTKRFGDKPPYETFEVVIRKMNTEEVDFNGKQLEEKAAAGIFKLGDIVSIGQTKVNLEKSSGSGRSSKMTSNAFEIKVIKSAI